MECRKIKITLVSANNLPDVRYFGQMKVYAKVTIKGESKTSQKTPTDMKGETNPRWNFPIEYTISNSAVQTPGINLSIRLYCKRTLGDKYIGEVNIPIKSLFDKGVMSGKILSYMVCGTPKGTLNILYSFGDKFLARRESGLDSGSGLKAILEVGFMILLGGAILLLGNDGEHDHHVPALPATSNVRIVEHDDDDDDDIFYDAE